MYLTFHYAIITGVYVPEGKDGVVYATLESALPDGFGECKVTFTGVDPDQLRNLPKLPFVVSGDVLFRVWGSGKDAMNLISIENVHIEDPLGMMKAGAAMMKAAQNGKQPEAQS